MSEDPPPAFDCPYCGVTDDRLGIHGHLVDEHADELRTDIPDSNDAIHFALPCPECDEESFSQKIRRPREDAHRVQDTYRDELAMIAFDQLLYHLDEEHGY